MGKSLFSQTFLIFFSFARIPDINRDNHMGDDREIKILHKNLTDDFKAEFERDGSIDAFSKSSDKCRGTKRMSEENLVFYDFT